MLSCPEEEIVKLGPQPRKWLEKRIKRGMRGYPVGTIAFYGPDNSRASKVAIGIAASELAGVGELRRWFAETGDVRADKTIFTEIAAFLREHGVQSVAMVDGNHRLPPRRGHRLSGE